MNRLSIAALVLGSLATFACSGADDGPPSLIKAPPFAYGTTCTKIEDSSYGTSSSHKETPMCLELQDCADLEDSTGYGYGGGATYNSSTDYRNIEWFEGDCSDKRAISCDDRPQPDACASCQYKSCCSEVAICEDDPNCLAINDCVGACKNDDACVKSCLDRGESHAAKNLVRAATCIQSACKSDCEN